MATSHLSTTLELRRLTKQITLPVIALLVMSSIDSVAATEPALRGYDPVAYFSQGKAVKGADSLSITWMGKVWHFAERANLAKFRASPEKYAPQYGAFCAYAVSQGYTAPVDPEAWAIVDGRLFLNYSKAVQKKWEARRTEYIAAADRNWPALRAKQAAKK